MSDSGTKAVLEAWISALATATSLSVYTHTPQDTAGSYLVVTLSGIPDDHKTGNHIEHEVTVDIYADPDYRGLEQVLDLAKLVYDAVHRVGLTVSGYWSSEPRMVRENYLETPDGPRGELVFAMQSGAT